MTPEDRQRLQELARRGALDLHFSYWRYDFPGKDLGGHETQSFETCPHPDCVLVRIGGVETPPAFDFLTHLQRQREWSGQTFGPGTRTQGVIDHIRKELREVEADPADISEWIDVVILGLDGAWRAGFQPQQIIDALSAKQAKNEAREWPDWRSQPTDKAIEHVRGAVETPAQEPLLESAERTLKSIATMLGWGNVPPRETLERDIAALKARSAPFIPPPAMPQDERRYSAQEIADALSSFKLIVGQGDDGHLYIYRGPRPLDGTTPVSAVPPPATEPQT